MNVDQPDGMTEVQEQIDDLLSRANAADQRASASESRADEAELRADDSETRADAAGGRTAAEGERSRDDRRRLADVEGRLEVHEEMIAELQAEGLISSEQAAHLEIALHTAARSVAAEASSSFTDCRVSAMLVPVSPSGTGYTFRRLMPTRWAANASA